MRLSILSLPTSCTCIVQKALELQGSSPPSPSSDQLTGVDQRPVSLPLSILPNTRRAILHFVNEAIGNGEGAN